MIKLWLLKRKLKRARYELALMLPYLGSRHINQDYVVNKVNEYKLEIQKIEGELLK